MYNLTLKNILLKPSELLRKALYPDFFYLATQRMKNLEKPKKESDRKTSA